MFIPRFKTGWKIGLAALAAVLLIGLPSGQALADDFNSSNIIDNSYFVNTGAMSQSAIQTFLTNQGGFLASWTDSVDMYSTFTFYNSSGAQVSTGNVCEVHQHTGLTAAQIIYQAATGWNPQWISWPENSQKEITGCGTIESAGQDPILGSNTATVNPEAILTTLQKEQILITATGSYSSNSSDYTNATYPSNQYALDWAMGYGVPDSGTKQDQYAGFYNQVMYGGWQLRLGYECATSYGASSTWTGFDGYASSSLCASKNQVGQSVTIDGTPTTMGNASTASLYDYTPHFSGNDHFVNLWEGFGFGPVHAPTYSDAYYGQSNYPTISPGGTAAAYFEYQNTGTATWCDDSSVVSDPTNCSQPVHLATSQPINRTSIFAGGNWGAGGNRPALTFSAVYLSDGVTLASNQHEVTTGEIAKFSFTITAPANIAAGTYQENFAPVVEGTANGALNDPGTFLDITISPVYASTYAGQSSPPTIAPGQSSTAYIEYTNTGNVAWYDDTSISGAPGGSYPVHLATSHSLNRSSAFAGGNWGAGGNRPDLTFSAVYTSNGTTLASNQHVAQPGQIVKFSFVLTVPAGYAAGTYQEYFQPVAEGTSNGAFADPGTYLNITVPALYSATYKGQSAAPTLVQGQPGTTVYIEYTNTGNVAWYDDTSIGGAPAGSYPVHLATSHPINRASAFGSSWGGNKNRPDFTFSGVYQADGTTLDSTNTASHIVPVGEVAKFSFTLTASSSTAPGSYLEYFQPVAEGTSNGAFADPGTYLNVTVQAPVYQAGFVGQSNYPTISRGGTAAAFFEYQNVGNMTWYDDNSIGGAPANNFAVHLATSHPINRTSVFAGGNWGGNGNRPDLNFTDNGGVVYNSDGTTLATNQHTVAPGQFVVFKFNFTVAANQAVGSYLEYFQPVAEGTSSGAFNDPGTALLVTVTP